MFGYLFSFQGRSGRFAYIMFGLVWFAVAVAFYFSIVLFGLISPVFLVVGSYALMIAAYISSFAIVVRRLHDINLSGWVLAFILALCGVLVAIGYWFKVAEALPDIVTYVYLGIYAFVSVFYVMLAVWPGTDDGNAY